MTEQELSATPEAMETILGPAHRLWVARRSATDEHIARATGAS